MSTFTWQPDWDATKNNNPRITKLQFGDGYEQRTKDGLNTNPETWNNTFKRDPTTINNIDNFLITRGGVEAFNWTTPRGRSATFKCEEWDAQYNTVGWSTLTATFVEVFEVVSP